MKRGGPLKRTGGLKRAPFVTKQRQPLPAKSARTKRDEPARAECREIVLARDRVCRGQRLTPVRCAGVATDVHELKRGSARRSVYLDPDMCIGLCRPCHDWVTANPNAACELGLALKSWE